MFLFIQNTFSDVETIKIGDNVIQPEKNWLEILRIQNGVKTIHPKLLLSERAKRLSSDSDRFLFNIIEDDKDYFMGFNESEDFFFYKLDVIEAMMNDPVPDSGGCRVIYKKKCLTGKYCKLDSYLQDFNMKVIEPHMKDLKGSEFVIIKLKDALLETFTNVKINSSYKAIC